MYSSSPGGVEGGAPVGAPVDEHVLDQCQAGEVWSLLTSITGDMRKEAVTSRAAITMSVKAPLVGKCGGGAVLFKNLCKLVDW